MKRTVIVMLFVLMSVLMIGCATFTRSGGTVGNTSVLVYSPNSVPETCEAVGIVTTTPFSFGQAALSAVTLGAALFWDFGPDFMLYAAEVIENTPDANAIVVLDQIPFAFEALMCNESAANP